jgi:hypothetical protein
MRWPRMPFLAPLVQPHGEARANPAADAIHRNNERVREIARRILKADDARAMLALDQELPPRADRR